MYEVTAGTWSETTGWYEPPFAVTDDLMHARTLILESVVNACGRMTSRQFGCFERLFGEFEGDTSRPLYFSIHDHHFRIAEASIGVYVGGMSTI